MNFFDQIKVPVPFNLEDLEKTIKLVQERKEYYLNPTEEKSESKPAATAEEKAPEDTETKKVLIPY